MATTSPWNITLFDDNSVFAPIQSPFNLLANDLNTALSAGAFQQFATKALMDAAPGTKVGQHATVNGDTAALNGDYYWTGTAWTLLVPRIITKNYSGNTDAAGLINSIPHNMSTTPSVITLQQYFTNDNSDVTGLTKLTVGAITSTTFQVVAYRNDTHKRLVNTAVSFGWVAFA